MNNYEELEKERLYEMQDQIKAQINRLKYEQEKIKFAKIMAHKFNCAFTRCAECPFKRDFGKCATHYY